MNAVDTTKYISIAQLAQEWRFQKFTLECILREHEIEILQQPHDPNRYVSRDTVRRLEGVMLRV